MFNLMRTYQFKNIPDNPKVYIEGNAFSFIPFNNLFFDFSPYTSEVWGHTKNDEIP